MPENNPDLTITTYADSFGRFHARVQFSHTLSESDPRKAFNLGHQWPRLRARARTAVVNALVEREQKTDESHDEARARIRSSLGRLNVTGQDIDPMNRWYGVSFGEAP